jgi:hypothetical protein
VAASLALVIVVVFVVAMGGCSADKTRSSSATEKVNTNVAALNLADNAAPGDLSNIGTGDFSITFELATSQNTGTVGVLGQRPVCNIGMFWDIRVQAGNLIVETDDATNNNEASHYTLLTSTRGVADGGLHSVQVQRASGTLTITIDGMPSGSTASAASFASLPPVSAGVYGCVTVGGDGTGPLVGTLALASVNNSLLFAQDLSNIHTSDFYLDFFITTSQNTGTVGVIGQRSVCGGGDFWDVRLSNGLVSVETEDAAFTYNHIASTVGVADGHEHRVELRRVSGTLYIVIDGAGAGSGPSAASFGSLPSLSTGAYACVNRDGTVELTGTLTVAENPTPPNAVWDSSPDSTHDLSDVGGAWADDSIAVSESHVVVTQRDAIGYYTRKGTPLTTPIKGDDFFGASLLPANSSGVFDLRTTYDPYRHVFVITGDVGSNGNGDDRLLMAVSKDSNPTDGWHMWSWGAGGTGNSIDKNQIAVTNDAYVVTYNINNPLQAVLRVFPANTVASGASISAINAAGAWMWTPVTANNGGFTPGEVCPVTMHARATDPSMVYAVTRYPSNGVTVFRIHDPFNQSNSRSLTTVNAAVPGESFNVLPYATNQGGKQEGTTWTVGTDVGTPAERGATPLRAVYSTTGELGFVTNDAHDYGDGNGLRAVAHFVTMNPDTGVINHNIKWGQVGYDYGWPGLEVNNNGDWAFATMFMSSTSNPGWAYSEWAHGEPSIRPYIQFLFGGSISWGPTHCGGWCSYAPPGGVVGEVSSGAETGSAALDPDGTSIWFSGMYAEDPRQGSFTQGVAKVFGYPVCAHDVCSTGTSLIASCQLCAEEVCSHDPHCCSTSWDSTCVGEVNSICGLSCP